MSQGGQSKPLLVSHLVSKKDSGQDEDEKYSGLLNTVCGEIKQRKEWKEVPRVLRKSGDKVGGVHDRNRA